MQTLSLFPLSNYTFAVVDHKLPLEVSFDEQQYKQLGMRTSVHSLLILHQHNHPHVLMFNNNSSYSLPGGVLKPGEDDAAGLKRLLDSQLAANIPSKEWEIGDLISVLWRPHFEDCLYPYLPTHITKPKEMIKIFIIHLPETLVFSVAKSNNVIAVPLYELHNNNVKYTHYSSLPTALSRFNYVYQ